ncbi:hypothetical protein O2W14_15955 [Modestobacter sp. VKM Ac-2986]|uniref:hypothetical protein n=1 Tax=Modestobacter sp. VKM Ac-2986 TaxID=3004140 RepID=UPI0022AB8BDE|nr:hypothetical protein [Modestobacter sp. VKM Ac-2986]MCZ2830331.1 hypothetical protein [Modestobacter sp. VKM Ac-2986]
MGHLHEVGELSRLVVPGARVGASAGQEARDLIEQVRVALASSALDLPGAALLPERLARAAAEAPLGSRWAARRDALAVLRARARARARAEGVTLDELARQVLDRDVPVEDLALDRDRSQ